MTTMIYTFSVEGREPFHCDATAPIEAFTLANRHYGSLPQGAWMETSGIRAYRWARGNFFD